MRLTEAPELTSGQAALQPARNSLPSSVGVYVHIPYCVSKCPYCDFNSVAVYRWPEDDYVNALIHEIEFYSQSDWFAGHEVTSVYFGGGTPSLFSARSLERILLTITRSWRCQSDIEVTVEANPGTVNSAKLRSFREIGINRLSLGVQSFNETHLRLLGRVHNTEEALRAVEGAFVAGFENINIDLIYALPGQSLSQWEEDLRTACALGPTHLSAYNLTYEDGTLFYALREQGRLVPLDEDIEAAMFLLGEELLHEHGYTRYEISNYAQSGFVCRHNLKYWSSEPYVGVGAGAHGFSPVGGNLGWGVRWANERSPRRYMEQVHDQGHARVSLESLDYRRAAGEFMFLALRRADGVDARAFSRRFRANAEALFPVVSTLLEQGLLETTASGWRLSPRGTLLADSVFAEFC
ncbi:MAG: radical SAM family heme chaperone HemW [Candidatus Binatia bacterium]|nr:radical SAM family heme chaperone HemW [Candidatus Binatia bacterium]